MLLSDFWSEARKPFNAVMMVIAIVSLLFALAIWYLSQQMSQLSYKVIQLPVVNRQVPGVNNDDGNSGGQSPPFSVTDAQGALIKTNIYAADITIWNSGDIELGREKVRRPLSISISAAARILDRGINRVSDPILGIEVSTRSSYDTQIQWTYLDPRAGFRIRIIYGSDKEQPLSLSANILGIEDLQDINNYRRGWKWYLKMIVVAATGFSLFVFGGPAIMQKLMGAFEKKYGM
jgi:hypothetical protein